MSVTCLDCSHKMICSVFKNIDNIRSELNQMLDYSGTMADVMPDFTPTKELWKYLAERCYFFNIDMHVKYKLIWAEETEIGGKE
jgi:heat shock protein HspQ